MDSDINVKLLATAKALFLRETKANARIQELNKETTFYKILNAMLNSCNGIVDSYRLNKNVG